MSKGSPIVICTLIKGGEGKICNFLKSEKFQNPFCKTNWK